MIGVVMLGERLSGVEAVDRTAGCEHEVFDVRVPATLEDVLKAEDVALDVRERILDRIAHAGLRGEMDDASRALLTKQTGHLRAVGHIEQDELESIEVAKLPQSRFLQPGVVIRIQVIDADDVVATLEQATGDVISDEAGRAGDENHASIIPSRADGEGSPS